MGSQPFPMGPTQHAPHSGPGMPRPTGPPAAFPGPPGQQMYQPRGPTPGMGMPWGPPMPGMGPAPVPQQSPWTTHMSPSGAPYYYNHVTRESTWVRPPALAGPPPQAPSQPQPVQGSAAQPTVVSADQVPGTNWKRVTCADGRVYFSNASTNTTVWTCPPEIAHLVPPARPMAPPARPQVRPGPPNNMAPPSQRPEGAPPPLARPPPALQPPSPAPDVQQSPAGPPSGPPGPHPQMPPHHMGGNGAPGPGAMNGPGAIHAGHGIAAAAAAPPGWPQWPMHARPAWMPGQPNPADQAAAAAAKADAEAEAAKEAAENVKHEFFKMLLEHKINAFSRWEACKKFESDPRFQAVSSKERKGLFNSFCANVVEETRKTEERARTAATKGLKDLFTELLGVTPLQFRLFREGKELEEVEAETVLQETERAQRLKAIAGEEPEDGEQGEDGHDKHASGQDSDEQLAVAASNADLDLVPGGLFTAGMKVEDFAKLVPEDKRWSSASEELQQEIFAEVVGPLIEQRAELDAKTVKRFQKRMHAWLNTQNVGGTTAEAVWEELKGLRPPLLALLPDRICLHILKHYMEASRKSQKERDRQASAKAASESTSRRKREAEQNAEQRQQEAAKLTDEEAFRTLLFEAVKDPSKASWASVKDKLRKDHGQRMMSRLITPAEYEKLFHAHVAALLQTARRQYTAAMEELIRPALVGPDGNVLPDAEKGQLATDWTAASEVLASQPCFQKLSSQERRERWNAFVGATEEAAPMPSAHKRRDREQHKQPETKRSRR